MISIPFKLKKYEVVTVQLLGDRTITVVIYNPATDVTKKIATFKGAYSHLYWALFKTNKCTFIGSGSGNIISLHIKELILNQNSEDQIRDIDMVI